MVIYIYTNMTYKIECDLSVKVKLYGVNADNVTLDLTREIQCRGNVCRVNIK